MLSTQTRHRLLQTIFWNPLGARIVRRLVSYERKFDVVVRNYSLIGNSNGEHWIPRLIPQNALMFDVGFHDVASTAELLQARPNARVIGFDPSRFAAQSYQAGFAQDKRVSFVHAGLSNQAGQLDFYDYENMCNSFTARKETPELAPSVYTVPVTTLDIFCAQNGIERVNFIKVDAEGYDLNVLEGANGLFSEQRVEIFMFEFASGWSAAKRYLWEAVEYFDPLPYSLFRLFNGFLCPFQYHVQIDSACTLSAMYVGVSEQRLAHGDIPIRNYDF
jgi:FkbM family methyltransferase